MSPAKLLAAALGVREIETLMRIAVDLDRWDTWHVFPKPPVRLGFDDDSGTFGDKSLSFASRRDSAPSAREILARTSGDDAGEVSSRDVKIFYAAIVAISRWVRRADNAESGLLERAVEQADAGED